MYDFAKSESKIFIIAVDCMSKKILILAANPLETARLRLDKEVEEIRTTLQLSANRDRFAIESRGAVRPQDLQQHLFNLKPQILHFSGPVVGIGV